jgi:hypothetical protein
VPKEALLKRYWFRFESQPFDGLGLGCGVTAYDVEDAKSLLGDSMFRDTSWPRIIEIIEDVDVSTLDRGHVLSNMEPAVWRGVWYPKGYRLP